MTQIKSPSQEMSELAHYGVKGMKWGVRKAASDKMAARKKAKAILDKPNPNYNDSMRRRDRHKHGAGGVKRINRRMNKGHDLKTARKKEVRFQKNRKLAIGVGLNAARIYQKRKEIAFTLGLVGGILAQNIAKQAETNRGRAAAAEAMGLPRHATTGPNYAKANRKGVYNISSL